MQESNSYVAFYNDGLLRSGTLAEVLAAVKLTTIDANASGVLFFSNKTGQQIDFDMRGTLEEVLERARKQIQPAAGRGRPRLGVDSREVTLLPRHWQWLQSQPSGASATLRKLVEEKMRDGTSGESAQRTREAAYKIMSAISGNRVNFEEASRALFAGDVDRFSSLIDKWPPDIAEHLKTMVGTTSE